MTKLDMPNHIYEIHNPKIAKPYMENLLEKLSESSPHWYGDSYGNDLMANVSLQYQDSKWITIQIPNSNIDSPEEEFFSNFHVYHNDGGTYDPDGFNKCCESLDEAVKVATDLLKELGGDKTVPKYCVTITRSEKGHVYFDNYKDAKKFEKDGFISDDIKVKWNGGEDIFDLKDITYWRKN